MHIESHDIPTFSDNFRFTYQQQKQLRDIDLDLKSWQLGSLDTLYTTFNKSDITLKTRDTFFEYVVAAYDAYKNSLPNYDLSPNNTPRSPKLKIQKFCTSSKIFGPSPAHTAKTICSNLMTIDAVYNCSYSCTYCSIQSFFSNGHIQFHENLSDELKKITLDSTKRYHFGTGQSSDSLLWGNRFGLLDDICTFTKNNPNIFMELKTKSKNIKYFLETNGIPQNLFCSWSLNPQIIVENEEHYTASVNDRLESARQLVDKGMKVGFHFHPMIHFSGWENHYKQLADQVMDMFQPRDIMCISFGSLHFIKPVIKNIRKAIKDHDIQTKSLQMPLTKTNESKWGYPVETKKMLYKSMFDNFASWHKNVFFYVCMETADIWNHVFGYTYKNSNEFETALLDNFWKRIE